MCGIRISVWSSALPFERGEYVNSKVLIVEDEAKLREVLCDYFRSKGEIPSGQSVGTERKHLRLSEGKAVDL